MPRSFWFGAALLLFLVSSWTAFRQEPCPNAYAHERINPLYTHWWLKPIELNAPQSLPEVWADFNDVFALKGTGRVWAVGGGGLILHSTDHGKHWERQYLVDPKDPAGDQPVSFQAPVPSQRENPPRAAAKAATLRPEAVPFWSRLLPGRPLESALLVSFLPEVKAPSPRQQPLNPAQQSPDPNQKIVDPFLPDRSKLSNNLGNPQTARPGSSKRVTELRKYPPKPARTSPSTTTQPALSAPEPRVTLRELANSDLYSVHFVDAQNGWVGGDNGALFFTRNGGRTWTRQDAGVGRQALIGLFFRDSSEGSIAIDHSMENPRFGSFEEYSTRDRGAHWRLRHAFGFVREPRSSWRQFKPDNQSGCLVYGKTVGTCLDSSRPRVILDFKGVLSAKGDARARSFSNAEYGWIADADGRLITTADHGQTWRRATRKPPQPPGPAPAFGTYHLLPARWYYLSLLAVGLLFVPALRLPKPEVISESAADLLVSDNPISSPTADAFDFSAVALGLSRFLRNEKTMPPLTIAVTGEWGSGKSSLMNLLRADLERYGFRPVWFNAWHHQKEENLLASLLETVRARAIPRWWRPEGAIFRYRLLKIRWLRFWPVVTLILVVFAFSLGYLHTHPSQLDAAWKLVGDLPSWLADPAKWLRGESQKMSAGQETDGHVPWIAFLLSSAGLLVSVWKGLKGFGVNPASLLAKDSGSAKVKDLENLTGFRYRFAAEFRDITRALNPRTLLILIDDLDRCRPEMVLEVLESVNFLVSSGDCFVVMGMARERVVRCVGLSFKDVASELLVTTPGPADQGLSPGEIARRQRIEFAQQYLEKLINIEVPVPAPTDEQSRRLMLAAGEPPEAGTPESRGRVLARESWALTRRVSPFVAVVGLLALGYGLGATRPVRTPAVPPAAVLQPAAPSPAQSAAGPAKAAPSPATLSAKPLPTGPAHMEPGEEARLPLYPPVLLLIVLVGLGVWRLSIPPGVVLHDSPDFEQALRTWHPLVFSYRNTPRSIKRFLNRVRYLAMLQRKQGAEPARWESLLALLLRRPVGVEKPAAVDAVHPAPIPEHVLVALAAVEHCHPEWLQDAQFFANPQGFIAPVAFSQEIRNTLSQTPLAPYREAYVRMSSGLHVS
ncbi:MAG TPA: P-loop NTPase fold protein [Thermoanaerobaculia bacterium]